MESSSLVSLVERAVADATLEMVQEWSVALDAALQCDYVQDPRTGEVRLRLPGTAELLAEYQRICMRRLASSR